MSSKNKIKETQNGRQVHVVPMKPCKGETHNGLPQTLNDNGKTEDSDNDDLIQKFAQIFNDNNNLTSKGLRAYSTTLYNINVDI